MKKRVFLLLTAVVLSPLLISAVFANEVKVKPNPGNEVIQMDQIINAEAGDAVQTGSAMKEEPYSEALNKAQQLLTIPEGYTLKSVQSQRQNADDVWVFRYEKSLGDHQGLGGEHFSFTLTKNQYKLLGFTWMDGFLSEGELPSKEETMEIAKSFLNQVEPGLFEQLNNLWIDVHHEAITLKHGSNHEQVTISGMKYKCFSKETNDYAWVIVGTNGKVITFEQGIQWVNGRVTEKWLHDSWLAEHQGN